MSDDSRYRLIGDHAENLSSGRMVAPGEYIDADALDTEDKWLLDEGRIVEADVPSDEDRAKAEHDQLVAQAKTLDISGRTKMSDDELRAAITEAEEAK